MKKRKTFIPFGSENGHSIDYFLGIIEDVRYTTLHTIEGISTEELHWQIHEGWNTVGVLLSHMISCEKYFRIEFIEDKRLNEEERKEILPGMDMGKHIPELITNQSVEAYIAELEISRKALIQAIRKLSVEDFHKKREGYNPETGHNLAWTLYHMAEDEVHHRGQMTIIRKLYKRNIGE